VTGPSAVAIDFSLFKNFPFNDRAKIQVRAEAFNLINHPNFTSMSTTYDGSNPGQLNAAQAARQIQFAMKFLF